MKSFPRKSAHEVFTEKRETDRSADGKCAIGIFIKAPKAGSSKTRLSPPFTPAECAALSRCFLKDTAENISNVAREKKDVIGIGVYAPVGSKRNFQVLLPADFLLIPQRGEDLGERLRNAAEDLFSAGFGSVCFIGADSPTLPPSYLARMVDYLGRFRNGMAIGPSADGGYYAIGLKKAIPRLFEDIDWSTDRVFEQTKARINELGIPRLILPAWYDVDDEPALRRLFDDLYPTGSMQGARLAYPALHTKRFLSRELQRFNPHL